MNLQKTCIACDDPFYWDDVIVIVGDELYHKDCVQLYPTGYVAFLDGDCLGITENDEGQDAYEVLEKSEYLEG
ncbi:hypothetical protein [Virgibacillus proomii]|uniref:hypothetical protein n=1 Tax=Virgibacillus proomii TaxID=84407 RepID=UPI0009850801|nr:hypothetical protein [Virgibacillus proomii]